MAKERSSMVDAKRQRNCKIAQCVSLFINFLLPQCHFPHSLQLRIGYYFQLRNYFFDFDSLIGNWPQHSSDQSLQIRMSDCSQNHRRRVAFTHAWLEHALQLLQLSHLLPMEHFQKNYSQRPDIRCWRKQRREMLGREVVVSARRIPEAQHVREGRHHHVRNQELAVLIENVGGLDVSVDDALAMQPLHALSQLLHLLQNVPHFLAQRHLLIQIAFRTVLAYHPKTPFLHIGHFSEAQERVSALGITGSIQPRVKGTHILHHFLFLSPWEDFNDLGSNGIVVNGLAESGLAKVSLAELALDHVWPNIAISHFNN